MCPLPARPAERKPEKPKPRLPKRPEIRAFPVSVDPDHTHVAVPRPGERQSTSKRVRPIKIRVGLTEPEREALARGYERVLRADGLDERKYKPSSYLYDQVSARGVDLSAWGDSAERGIARQQNLRVVRKAPRVDPWRAGDAVSTRAAHARLLAYTEEGERRRLATALPRDHIAVFYVDEWTGLALVHWAKTLGVSISILVRLILVDGLLPDDPSVGVGVRNLDRFYSRALAVADAGEFPPLPDKEVVTTHLCRYCKTPMPAPSS